MNNRIGKQSSLSQIPFWGVKVKLSYHFGNRCYYRQSHCARFSLGLLKLLISLLTTAGGLIQEWVNSASNTSDSPSSTEQLQEANCDSKGLRIPAQKFLSFCIASQELADTFPYPVLLLVFSLSLWFLPVVFYWNIFDWLTIDLSPCSTSSCLFLSAAFKIYPVTCPSVEK